MKAAGPPRVAGRSGRAVALLALAGLLVAAGLALRSVPRSRPAAPPSAATTAAPEPGPWRYRILDPDERPVAGARVERFLLDPRRMDPISAGEFRSGADGGVRMAAADPARGTVVLGVRAAGLAPEVFAPEPGEADLHLTRGRPVRGVVLDLFGRPVAGARVLTPEHPPFSGEAQTGPDGAFDLGVRPDDAMLRFQAAGRAPLDISLALFPVDVAVTLPPGHEVAGRVVDTRGEPVPGAVVRLEQESVTRVAAGADGRFRFAGVLPDWEVLLTPLADHLVGESAIASCGEEDVTLVLYRPASVRGHLVEGRSGRPRTDGKIHRLPAMLGPGGAFRIGDLPPGPLRIAASAGELSGEVTVDLTEGETRTDVQVSLFPPRWVPDGFVRAAWPVTVRALDEVTGRPVAGALVSSLDCGADARTDADGRVTVLLPAGRCRLACGGPLEAWAARTVEIEVPRDSDAEVRLRKNRPVVLRATGDGRSGSGRLWVRAGRRTLSREVVDGAATFPATVGAVVDLWLTIEGCLPVERTELTVPADGTIEVSASRGAFVRGRCLEPSGRPLARVGIEVEDLPPESRVETAGDGLFAAGPVRPGTHRLLINARNVRTRRFTVEVPAGGLDLGDVTMSGPCALSVLVTTSAGEPIPGAFVTTTYRVAAKGVTNGAGRITLPGTEDREALKARADGYLDGWVEIRVAEGERRQVVPIRLLRPARLLVRTVDGAGRAVSVRVPQREDFDALVVRTGELLLSRLAPGDLSVEITDQRGRTGTLHHTVKEGEEAVATVILR